MLHLIVRLVPAPVHRAVLPLAFRLRHRWRRWRKVPLTGCNVVVTDLDGAVLLLRHSYGPDHWGLPGGGLGRGEDPACAAARELSEELGLENLRLKSLGTVEGVLSGSPHTAYLFTTVIDRYPQLDRREVIEARFFPPHSLPEPLGATTREQLAAWRERRG